MRHNTSYQAPVQFMQLAPSVNTIPCTVTNSSPQANARNETLPRRRSKHIKPDAVARSTVVVAKETTRPMGAKTPSTVCFFLVFLFRLHPQGANAEVLDIHTSTRFTTRGEWHIGLPQTGVTVSPSPLERFMHGLLVIARCITWSSKL